MAKVSLSMSADGNYFKFFHLSLYSGRVTTRSINQTSGIQNLDATSYFDNLAIFPPLPTQRAIAAFLDAETTRIDGLIKDYEELIERSYRSGVLDTNICEVCLAKDGQEHDWGDPEMMAPDPECLGGARCRCVNIAVMKAESEGAT